MYFLQASAHQKNLDVGANIFIGNLDPEVDEKLLYDTFSAFGVILQTPKVFNKYLLMYIWIPEPMHYSSLSHSQFDPHSFVTAYIQEILKLQCLLDMTETSPKLFANLTCWTLGIKHLIIIPCFCFTREKRCESFSLDLIEKKKLPIIDFIMLLIS